MNYKDFLEEYEKLMEEMRYRVDVPTFIKMAVKTLTAQALYCAPDEVEALKLIHSAIKEGIEMYNNSKNKEMKENNEQ